MRLWENQVSIYCLRVGTCSAAAGAGARRRLETYNSQDVHLILQMVVLQPLKDPLKGVYGHLKDQMAVMRSCNAEL